MYNFYVKWIDEIGLAIDGSLRRVQTKFFWRMCQAFLHHFEKKCALVLRSFFSHTLNFVFFPLSFSLFISNRCNLT